MNNSHSSQPRHRIRFDAAPGFESNVRLLAARWGVKTNVAIQRSVEQSLARKRPDDEKAAIQTILSRVEELTHHLLP